MGEAHVPAQQPETQEDARFSLAYGYSRRPRGPQGASTARPGPALRLIRPVRDRATFAALARAPRVRRGPITLSFVPDDEPDARVAYALSRRVGSAVGRNRIRRRIRAAVAANATTLRGGSYLFGASRAVVDLSFDALVRSVGELVAAATRHA
jgi:ribonuclease P protein component